MESPRPLSLHSVGTRLKLKNRAGVANGCEISPSHVKTHTSCGAFHAYFCGARCGHRWATGRERMTSIELSTVQVPDHAQLVKPAALVVLTDASAAGDDLEQELRTLCREGLAPYKYPRWIEFVDELPKTATGKIQRFKLRT